MIKIKLNYISNFSFNVAKEDILKKKIFCKNFIVFIMFLNFFKKNKVSIVFKPLFRRSFDLLKAPYRFKMSKNQLFFSRFSILVSFFFYKDININSTCAVIFFYNNILNFFSNFEVNICLQNSVKIFFVFKYTKNFLIN